MPHLRTKKMITSLKLTAEGLQLTEVRSIYFDSDADTLLDVAASSGVLPAYKDDYPGRTDLYCDDVDAQWVTVTTGDASAGQMFRATCIFKTKAPNFYKNPLDRAEVFWGGSSRTEEVFVDVDGNTMTNSAGEVLDPLPTRTTGANTLTIINRQATNPGGTIDSFKHSVNSSIWYSSAAGTAKIGQPSSRPGQEAGVEFWEINWPIELNPDGHNPLVPDVGYNQLVGGKLERILLEDGTEPPQPSLLDGAGAVLTSGSPVTARSKLYRERNFSLLTLPNPWA
ncbi:MAG: hypothetical protein AAF916_04185 [Planctomycetota bacterium]